MSGRHIAVALVHGIGAQKADFADRMIRGLRWAFAEAVPEAPDDVLIFAPVHWAPVLQPAQEELLERVRSRHALEWSRLREVMVSFVGDGVAYEPTGNDRRVYDAVHAVMARALHDLAVEAGPSAPLCVFAHSLGTVVASNYLYDLGKPHLVGEEVRAHLEDSPLERGETLAHFFTAGSPLAVWALHHREFGRPLRVPAAELHRHHPDVEGGWINFFDCDDVIAFPLRELNEAYAEAVTEDVEVSVGGWLGGQTPLAHTGYQTDDEVLGRMATALAATWHTMNPDTWTSSK